MSDRIYSSGLAGHSYYPVRAEALERRILEQADFMSLSEASRFASAMAQIVAAQERVIVDLSRRLLDLEIAAE